MLLSQAKQYLPLIQAAAEGKTLQYITIVDTWYNCPPNVSLDFLHACTAAGTKMHNIRIKPPAPTLRPWKPEEVPVGALLRFSKDDKGWNYLILSCSSTTLVFVKMVPAFETVTFEDLVNNPYAQHSLDHGKTWLPCGVME